MWAPRRKYYSIINELARQGMAIIMISSELPEIINMCDNVCVIKEGVKTGGDLSSGTDTGKNYEIGYGSVKYEK